MEPHPKASPSCNEKRKNGGGLGSMDEDMVRNILERLPAASFAFASCVSRSWHRLCRLILFSRPSLASALSLHSSPSAALGEVVEKVLSAPIRPDFALAHITGSAFDLNHTVVFLGERLGWSTPIVVTRANGIMGRNVATNDYLEFNGGDDVHDPCGESKDESGSGVVLTVGFLPGIKVGIVPLLNPRKAPNNATIQQFITDIKSFSASASGSMSPAVIMMFGNRAVDQKPIINQLDNALSKETIIVGDERALFSYRSGKESNDCPTHAKTMSEAVALVLARDSNKPYGMGEIQFHTGFSRGLSEIGPVYQAVSVRMGDDRTTWLTAKRDGNQEILDGNSIISEINDELERRIGYPELFIGVTRRRKGFTGSENSMLSTLTFHGLLGGNEDYLFVDGTGIRTRDYFQFFMSDPDVALSSCNEVSAKIKNLKLECNSRHSSATASDVGREFIGGLAFACCGRGESFFGRPNVDSSPFLENFPRAPLAGIFCCGETARGISTGFPGHCCSYVYGTVYLGLSYIPASRQD